MADQVNCKKKKKLTSLFYEFFLKCHIPGIYTNVTLFSMGIIPKISVTLSWSMEYD